MMVNSISSVRFCGPTDGAATVKPEGAGFLDRPGAFAKPAENKSDIVDVKTKKKGSVGKKILAAVAGLVVVAGALVLGYKKDALKVLSEADKAGAGIMKKVGHYLGQAGKWLSDHAYDPLAKQVAKLFKKSGSAAA